MTNSSAACPKCCPGCCMTFDPCETIPITLHGQTQARINELKALADRYSMEEFIAGKAESLNFSFDHGVTADAARDYKYNEFYHIKTFKEKNDGGK